MSEAEEEDQEEDEEEEEVTGGKGDSYLTRTTTRPLLAPADFH